MRKYQILKEQSTLIGEIKVYRIQALRNIHTRLGMIPAGQLGAFIQSETTYLKKVDVGYLITLWFYKML